MDAPPAVRKVSVFDAMQEAVEHTRRNLFPFRLARWVALGFLAFLDQCGRGTGFGVQGVPGAPGGDGDFDPGAVLQWLAQNVGLVALIAAAVLALVVALLAAVLWVNSRGSFAYIDVVATGRADVARPWSQHAEAASSYFAWRFALVLITLSGLLVMAAGLAAVALNLARQGRTPGPLPVLTGFALLLALLVFATVMSLASVLLRDFVAPLQLATGLPCAGAARVLAALLAAHPGTFALFVLFKVVFSLVVAMLMMVACCFTCACGALPVVAQTLLQPAFHFERAWSLMLLRQMGHDVFAAPALL